MKNVYSHESHQTQSMHVRVKNPQSSSVDERELKRIQEVFERIWLGGMPNAHRSLETTQEPSVMEQIQQILTIDGLD
jgi:hypothetical protein